jgi:hypothetical protein
MLLLPYFIFNEVIQMIAEQKRPDPSDLRPSTIQQLFHRQIKALTLKSAKQSLNDKMRTFDLQFSDAWF